MLTPNKNPPQMWHSCSGEKAKKIQKFVVLTGCPYGLSLRVRVVKAHTISEDITLGLSKVSVPRPFLFFFFFLLLRVAVGEVEVEVEGERRDRSGGGVSVEVGGGRGAKKAWGFEYEIRKR